MATRLFGDRDPGGSEDDITAQLRRHREAGTDLPALYACCGTEDELWAENVALRDECATLGVDLRFESEPADHTWDYWDLKIQDVLAWLPRPGAARDSR